VFIIILYIIIRTTIGKMSAVLMQLQAVKNGLIEINHIIYTLIMSQPLILMYVYLHTYLPTCKYIACCMNLRCYTSVVIIDF